MVKHTNSDFGYDTTQYVCPNCGNSMVEQINRVHYGNDEYKK